MRAEEQTLLAGSPAAACLASLVAPTGMFRSSSTNTLLSGYFVGPLDNCWCASPQREEEDKQDQEEEVEEVEEGEEGEGEKPWA